MSIIVNWRKIKEKIINCDCCGNPQKEEKFKVCSLCKNSYYCSKECQHKFWNKFHKKTCKDMVSKNREAKILQSTVIMYKTIHDNEEDKKSVVFHPNTSNFWYIENIDDEYYHLYEEDEEHFNNFCKRIGSNNERKGMVFYGDNIGIMTGIMK